MNNGYLAIVLHAHLPYVHHPEHDSFFEENWLFERSANVICRYWPCWSVCATTGWRTG
ncbi:hypothetical protein [Methylomonas koyamae]|uniref:hypothetical protein n=1 Tax=Methylomonas koyamae TaxID=702114 RepID=UPI000AB68E6B|nr:hypothetical protein [Methylomonas koyamae]